MPQPTNLTTNELRAQALQLTLMNDDRGAEILEAVVLHREMRGVGPEDRPAAGECLRCGDGAAVPGRIYNYRFQLCRDCIEVVDPGESHWKQGLYSYGGRRGDRR